MSTLERNIARRLLARKRKAVSATQVIGALRDMDAGGRGELLRAIRANDVTETGRGVLAAVNAALEDEALADATAMLSDDSLSRDELETIGFE